MRSIETIINRNPLNAGYSVQDRFAPKFDRVTGFRDDYEGF
jgi:hypothetical protein